MQDNIEKCLKSILYIMTKKDKWKLYNFLNA